MPPVIFVCATAGKAAKSRVTKTPIDFTIDPDRVFMINDSFLMLTRIQRLPGYRRSSGGAISVTRSRIKLFFGNGPSLVVPSLRRVVQA